MTGQKVWFITGAGRGIGSDLVTAALEAGHNVVATARDDVAVTAEVGEHERLLALAMDVTDPSAVDGAVRKALDRFGSIDVLINNAGRFYTGFFETLSPEQVRAQMEVNFFGTLNVTRAVLPVMRAQRRGHVVTVSALVGIVGAPFISIFAASKFALEGWMESITPEVAPFGITTTKTHRERQGVQRERAGPPPKAGVRVHLHRGHEATAQALGRRRRRGRGHRRQGPSTHRRRHCIFRAVDQTRA
ncbi:short chain dehydrogenase [Stigmatella aurantiaca]|uniref:Short chain dehydrogenase n=1 Tax=Stigmatella aurantiaca TaxID=41 RepID=A0A1H7FFC9_STIAU|nr:SDR family oxidoreductase [Stigmatella aurantiaca]SEK21965.1 short chain dehydrogenase [Stigmatella aurantiaca]